MSVLFVPIEDGACINAIFARKYANEKHVKKNFVYIMSTCKGDWSNFKNEKSSDYCVLCASI